MRFRSTFALLVLFFTGLAALWYVDSNRVPTRKEQRELLNRLLPELSDVPSQEITRLEVETQQPPTRLSVERREGGLWQLTSPVDAAADPGLVETLVRNLIDLRKSTDAGTIQGNAGAFDLAPPRATLRLFGSDRRTELARLDLGQIIRDHWYVRPGGSDGIEVVDARRLGALAQDVVAWRDRRLFRIPSFRVASVRVVDQDPAKSLVLSRDERRWRMVEPLRTAADDDRAEGLVAELGALRAADGPAGFVEDGATNLATYGLDQPSMTITVTPFTEFGSPCTVRMGKPVPEQPDHVYALRDDQDDVLSVPIKLFRESFGQGPITFRSPRVGDFEPSRVSRVRIDWKGKRFDLVRTSEGWQRLAPSDEPADGAAVSMFLARLDECRASEFLAPGSVPDPRLDPPDYRIQLWHPLPGAAPGAPVSADQSPAGELRLDLKIGRHDLIRKTLFAQVAGDRTILALTDLLADSLPHNEFAFRSQAIETFEPAQVESLSFDRESRSITVKAPGSGSSTLSWRVTEPIDAPADDRAVTAILVALSRLRAVSWESTAVGDGGSFGLDRPRLRVRWQLRSVAQEDKRTGSGSPPSGPARTLRLGATKPGANGGTIYANLEGEPGVFTVPLPLAALLEAELRDRRVLQVPPVEIQRILFRWPGRSMAFHRGALTAKGQAGEGWAPELGFDVSGFDMRNVALLIKALENLEATRFIQDQGPFSEDLGLDPPRLELTIERGQAGSATRPFNLRFGAIRDGQIVVTRSTEPEGAAFTLLLNETWASLLAPPRRSTDLPADPFAPATTSP